MSAQIQKQIEQILFQADILHHPHMVRLHPPGLDPLPYPSASWSSSSSFLLIQMQVNDTAMEQHAQCLFIGFSFRFQEQVIEKGRKCEL